MEVVAHVHVRITVGVHVAYADSQSVTQCAAVDAAAIGDVNERAWRLPRTCSGVAHQPVTGQGVLFLPQGRPGESAAGVGRVVEHVHIKVAIQVVVEEGGLGAKAHQIQSVVGGLVFEGRNALRVVALVDVELVFASDVLVIAQLAHVDI